MTIVARHTIGHHMQRLIKIAKWFLFTHYQNYCLNNRKKLSAWQNKKAKTLLQFAIKHSKFYKEFYKGLSLEDWKKLPTINKKIWVENFSTLNTAGIDFQTAYGIAINAEQSRDFSPTIGEYAVGLSSGTSGNRGLFLVSERERAAWAGTILAKMLPKPLFSKQRIAFFLRANSNLYTSLKNLFIQFGFYDLLDDLPTHIKRLNQFQPSILIAPPSMLRILATAQEKNELSIKPIKIISVAEVLEPMDKAYIEHRFIQAVHQIYQATEGFLAITCQYGVLHLNEDLFVIEQEYISSGKFIPIITDLYRTTQPIIRYRLNDVLTERKTACPCGSPYIALDQIDGRCDDLFFLKSLQNGKLKPIFPDFIRRTMITSSEDLLEYQVIQTSLSTLEVNLHCKINSTEAVKEKIKEHLKMLCQEAEVHSPVLHFGTFSFPEKGVKLRRILRNFLPNEKELNRYL